MGMLLIQFKRMKAIGAVCLLPWVGFILARGKYNQKRSRFLDRFLILAEGE